MKFPYVAKFGDGTHITGRSIRELREAVAARFPGRSVQHDKRAGALIVRERRGRRWVEVGRATVTQRASHVWVVWRRNPVVGTMTGWIDGWRGLGAVVG